MIEQPIWYAYATFDEDGFVSGIRSDAPDTIKQAYEQEELDERKSTERLVLIAK